MAPNTENRARGPAAGGLDAPDSSDAATTTVPAPVAGGWRQRAGNAVVIAMFPTAAAGMGWLAKLGLLDPLAALRAGRPLVTFDPHDAVAPFVTVAMLAFCGMGLVGWRAAPPAPGPRRHRKALPSPRDIAAAALLWVAVACLGLFPFGPPVAGRVFERAATRAGYTLCPPLDWEHHPQQRWRRVVRGQSPPRCPRTREEADRGQ